MTAPGFHDQKKMVHLPSRHLYWQVQSRGERVESARPDTGLAVGVFISHFLGVSAAEGLTEWHHRKIRGELMKPESAIGVTLTSAYQLVPEASTSAIVVHHPAATYCLVKA